MFSPASLSELSELHSMLSRAHRLALRHMGYLLTLGYSEKVHAEFDQYSAIVSELLELTTDVFCALTAMLDSPYEYDEAPIDEFNPGPECDDQGGMSEFFPLNAEPPF